MFYSNYTVSVKKFPIGAMFTIRFHETIKNIFIENLRFVKEYIMIIYGRS